MNLTDYEYMKECVSKFEELYATKARLEIMQYARMDASNNWTLHIHGPHKMSTLTGGNDNKYISIICKAIENAVSECIEMIDKEMEAI